MNSVLIENPDDMDELCEQLGGEAMLAVDTEFFRETSYYPHLGLVQLAGPGLIACVDPLAFDARNALATLLLDPAITKIFHACIQDLEVLYQYLGQIPCPLIDTQIAAAMLGTQDQIGYARLVEEQMGVSLEKSQTRTNWLKRPLTSHQIKYAGEDVHYLLPMYEKQLAELEDKNRLDWLTEDCNRLCSDTSRFFPDMFNCWKRVKGASRLKGVELAVCYTLAQWREQLAMQKDLTRRKVLPDDLVVQIAITRPQTLSLLRRIGRLPTILDEQELMSMLEAIHSGLNRPQSEWPSQSRYIPGAAEKSLLKKLLAILRKRADESGVAQGLICSRKDIEKMINGDRNIQLLSGWRFEFVGEELLRQLDA